MNLLDRYMNRLDDRYRGLLAEVLYNGTEKNDRTGTGTLSRFGMSIRHNMEDGFPILTTKKMPLNIISTELKWFLKGNTNIKYCLLYTSPSPRDRTRSRMPSSA